MLPVLSSLPARRRTSVRLALAAVSSTLALASVADAKIPYIPFCNLPTVALGSASGTTAEFHAVVRDINDTPLAHQSVTLDFSLTSLQLYGVQDPGITLDCASRTLMAYTDGLGRVVFHPRFAGTDPSRTVAMTSDGIPMGSVFGRSTDLDALGGGTGLADYGAFAQAFGAGQPAATMNYDVSASDVPDLADFAILARQFALAATAEYCP